MSGEWSVVSVGIFAQGLTKAFVKASSGKNKQFAVCFFHKVEQWRQFETVVDSEKAVQKQKLWGTSSSGKKAPAISKEKHKWAEASLFLNSTGAGYIGCGGGWCS
jgi:hypothetical protein